MACTPAEKVDLSATPTTGLLKQKENGSASLDVSLISTPTITKPVGSYNWDFDGSGSNDLTCYSHANVKVSYAQAGLYLTRAAIVDFQGSTYEDTVIVNVLDRTEMDNMFKAKWNIMKTKLLVGNIEGALEYIADSSKDRYRSIFTQFGGEKINRIFSNISEIQLYEVYGQIAESGITRNETTGTFSYPVRFIQNDDGVWRVWGF